MEADKTVLQMKYARVVKLFAEQAAVSLEDSLEIFYDSYVYRMMNEGIADMHCRSDGYLAALLVDEWRSVSNATEWQGEKRTKMS